jgi:hypothetical protein
MATIWTKDDLAAELASVERMLSADLAHATAAALQRQREGWSAEAYVQHLLLSIKPFVRVLEMTPAAVQRRFGLPQHGSRPFAGLVALYTRALASGFRAETVEAVLPAAYRYPPDVTDPHAHLLHAWHDSHARLYQALAAWPETALDQAQVPHPAVGLLTVREMLFFTLHHNRLHHADIRAALGLA